MNKIENVSVDLKANIYFDGKVVSHTVHFQDGSRQTIGLIYPGSYNFKTGAPETMRIIAGHCKAKVAGQDTWKEFGPGTQFSIPGHSSFDIAVESGIAEYLCIFG